MKIHLCVIFFFLASVLAVQQDALFTKVLNAAIVEVLKGTCFNTVHQKYFSAASNFPYPAAADKCAAADAPWPTIDEINAEPNVMKQIISNHMMIFGAPLPDGHDKTNCTEESVTIGTVEIKVQTCAGYDVELTECLLDVINTHYSLSTPIEPRWIASEWMDGTDVKKNILFSLLGFQFDAVMASVSSVSTTTWPAPWDIGVRIPRSDLVNFTCPYMAGGESAAYGPRALPAGLTSLTVSTLNTAGLLIGVEAGTTMETWVQANCPQATLSTYTDGTIPRTEVIAGNLHVYFAPHLTIAQDLIDNPTLHLVGEVTHGRYSLAVRPSLPQAPCPSAASTISSSTLVLIAALLSAFVLA